MKLQLLVVAACFLLVTQTIADETNKRTAVFNQQWLKALVSIEVVQDNGNPKSIGTGFLVRTPSNHIALVTAKHVVFTKKGEGPIISNLAYRINNKKGKSFLILDSFATKEVKSGWIKSKKYDVACRLIVRAETSDLLIIPYSAFLPTKQLQAGAPLFIIGFPMGMRSEEYAMPIVRRAIVARPGPDNILVDGFVFPGNSGGPVIYEPSVRLGKGFSTQIIQGDWLAGLVLSEVSYIEPAISPQTGRARVTFEHNSGLCEMLPADRILDLLNTTQFLKYDRKLK